MQVSGYVSKLHVTCNGKAQYVAVPDGATIAKIFWGMRPVWHAINKDAVPDKFEHELYLGKHRKKSFMNPRIALLDKDDKLSIFGYSGSYAHIIFYK